MAASDVPLIVFIMSDRNLKELYTKHAKAVKATAVFFEKTIAPRVVHEDTLGVYEVLFTKRPDMVSGLRGHGHRNYIVGLLTTDNERAVETQRQAYNAAQANEVVGEFLTEKIVAEIWERRN